MSLFKNLFGKNRRGKECPRCLGKGQVDWNDIKRLQRELKWVPGICAYCNGTGVVKENIENNVPADAAYLVADLDEKERNLIINGNSDAIERGKEFDFNLEIFIQQIRFLHIQGDMTSAKIAEFFLIGENEAYQTEKELKELIDYIEKVIETGN